MTRAWILVTCGLLAAAGPAAAQADVLWTTPTGGSWGTAGNWSAGVPGPADTAVFDAALAPPGPYSVTLDGSRQVASVRVGSPVSSTPTGGVTIDAGSDPLSTLTLGGNLATLAANTGSLTVNVPVVAAAGFTMSTQNGNALAVRGLRATATAGATTVQVSATAAAPVRLGAGGLDVTAATQDFNLNLFGGSTLTLAASQDWAVTGRRILRTDIVGTTPGTIDLGPAGQTLTLRLTNPGADLPQVVFNNQNFVGAGGLTVAGAFAAGGTGAGAGYAYLGRFGTTTASGPLRVTGGTLNLGAAAAWAGTDVQVSGGQLLFANFPTNALPAGTTLVVSGTGAYNLGLPTLSGGVTDAPATHTQTYASVEHASTGAFNTGAGTITVSGTFTSRATGGLTVNPGGTLSVNRLDLQGVVSALPGAVTVRTDFPAPGPLVGRLTVGAGGLSLQGRSITLTATQAAANIGSVLSLDGDVTASGASGILSGSNNPHSVVLNNPNGRSFTVAAGGTLTVSAPLVNQGYSPGGATGTANSLIKRGDGTMVLSAVNFYTGFTRVDAGRLVLASGFAVPNSNTVLLSGGTLSTAGGAAGAGVSETAGALQVGSSSAIELGTGAHVLRFSNLGAGGTLPIPAGSVLLVTGWQGSAFGPGTAGRLVFNDNAGFTADVLSRVQFDGFSPGATVLAFTGTGGGFELVPVPEPGTALGLAAAGLGAARVRRRILAG